MARFIIPKNLVRFPPSKKYHIYREDGYGKGVGRTSCNLIVWPDGSTVDTPSVFEAVERVEAKDVCKKCLGALEVVD